MVSLQIKSDNLFIVWCFKLCLWISYYYFII